MYSSNFFILFLFLLSVVPITLLEAASTFPYKHTATLNLHKQQQQPSSSSSSISSSKRYEGSSDFVHLRYHMGPVLSSPVNLYLIWYGRWPSTSRSIIRDFLLSISDSSPPPPSLSRWWSTVSLYSDQTSSNVTRSFTIAKEHSNPRLTRGPSLTRLSIQQVIADAVSSTANNRLPVDHRHGVYLVLTSPEIKVQEFCRAVCGFHYFTFPSIVGHTLPYAWIGNSGAQCPEVCAYPFALPSYMSGSGMTAMRPPNDDVGVDGMLSVIGHELAELSTNPLINAWYAGEDPTAPTEIGDLCEGVYGTGGGGGYTGEVGKDGSGRRWNVNGRNGRKFLVQWVWSPVIKACRGPNALD